MPHNEYHRAAEDDLRRAFTSDTYHPIAVYEVAGLYESYLDKVIAVLFWIGMVCVVWPLRVVGFCIANAYAVMISVFFGYTLWFIWFIFSLTGR